MMKMKY